MPLQMNAAQSVGRPMGTYRTRPAPPRAAAARRAPVVQRAANPARAEWEESWGYQANAQAPVSMHTVSFVQTVVRRGTQLEIRVLHGGGEPAHLKGSFEGNEAFIDTVESGRFPAGRGVSYLLINRFAEQARRRGGILRVKLGTPVNTESVDKAALAGQNVAGERAAIHVYTSLGYDVSTPAAATTSSRTPEQLVQGTQARINGRWSQFFDVPL